MLRNFLTAAVAIDGAVAACAGSMQARTCDDAPVVDLGYALHQGALNVTGDFYAFRNIRFAEPLLPEGRFKPALPVSTVNRTVNDGSVGFACRQSYPTWVVEQVAAQLGVPASTVRQQMMSGGAQSEDCLFLDVMVPRKLYERRNEKCAKKAPVMVWIYGGGYVYGQKDDASYNPAGLLARSQDDGGEGIIYVALNYRLGMFGWLNAGDDQDIFPNVALQDQLLALEWVNKYVHLFGGDPDATTVFGQSAGGGSIMHHITAEGGKKAPFNRAILQSPGFVIPVDAGAGWKRTLAVASNITGRDIANGAELAALDSETLRSINEQAIGISQFATYTYGPTVDGGYVPDLPGVLLLQGRFDPSPHLMLGHNSNEGFDYFQASDDTDASLRAIINNALPGISRDTIEYLLTELYPPPPQTGLYENESQRGILLVSEQGFTCNTRYLGTAFGNETWNYRFQVPPGKHAQDIPYTFYNGKTSETDAALAIDMQLYFTNFGQFGSPDARGRLPEWPVYGDDARLATFGLDGVGTDEDETANKRCAYWQTGAFLKP